MGIIWLKPSTCMQPRHRLLQQQHFQLIVNSLVTWRLSSAFLFFIVFILSLAYHKDLCYIFENLRLFFYLFITFRYILLFPPIHNNYFWWLLRKSWIGYISLCRLTIIISCTNNFSAVSSFLYFFYQLSWQMRCTSS